MTPEDEEYLKTVKEIKELAKKIGNNYPPEWDEKFIEIDM